MEKTWIRQPQERDGDYHFDGRVLVTKGVHEALPPEEVLSLITETRRAVAESSGLDYLQVFKHKETGQKIYFIDELSKSVIDSGRYTEEELANYHVCTLLFPDEY